jgi:hypothetical protein
MVMRTIVILAILATMIVTDAPIGETLAKALHEFLKMGLVETEIEG